MRRLSVLFVFGAASLALVACDDDGPVSNLRPGSTDAPSASVAPEPEAPPEAAPPEAAPPAEAPPVEAPPAPAPEPTPNPPTDQAPPGAETPLLPTDSIWPILLGLGLLVLAGIVVAAVLRRRSPSEPPTPPRAPEQSSLLANAQWIHDHLTLELFAAPPADALQRWAIERTRLDDVAIGCQREWANGAGDGWSHLSTAMSSLATTLDTSLRLRAQVPPDPTLVQESVAVVTRQRAVVIRLVGNLWLLGSTPGSTRGSTPASAPR